jgi:hypothetical protein
MLYFWDAVGWQCFSVALPLSCFLLHFFVAYLYFYSSNVQIAFAVEDIHSTRYQSGSFSVINVVSGFHCLRNFFHSFRSLL